MLASPAAPAPMTACKCCQRGEHKNECGLCVPRGRRGMRVVECV